MNSTSGYRLSATGLVVVLAIGGSATRAMAQDGTIELPDGAILRHGPCRPPTEGPYDHEAGRR